ncbi:MAG: DUF4249 family protein [Bacteroidales bacterium]|nr:DUF4249 family protein [Bacteroidales bacterium]
MTIKTYYIFLIFAIIILGCKDEFLLETTNYKPILVVNGMITNEANPYTITLSTSSPINTLEKYPYENCIITLYENSDKSEVLKENEPGIYVTSEGSIQGSVGNNYSISILTPEGNEYITEPQEMKGSVEIDSVYAELIEIEDINYIYGLPGYQFYIDTKTASNQESYFLWNMIETYQYRANYPLWDIINMDDITLEEYKELYRCWKTRNSGYIFTGKTSNLTIPKIVHQPLHFVGTDTKKLQERYSLLLKQYSIGKESYYFWKSIEDQNSEENFLVASQPYNVIGNIKNINNPDESVFGNFTVASVTQKRIFIDAPRVAFYYDDGCSLNFDFKPYLPAFLVDIDDWGIAKVNEGCINCTFEGGEATKPDFWIDK